MAIRAAIICTHSLTPTFDMCEVLTTVLDDVADAELWAHEALNSNAWHVIDGNHFCPRHNPALAGEIVKIGTEYTELGPGVCVRLQSGGMYGRGDTFPIEVLREKAG